ncbi:MAG: EamA family transporter RarD [Actinomycetota bacterium]
MTLTPPPISTARSRSQLGLVFGFSAYAIWGLLTMYWKVLKSFDAFELIGWRISLSTIVLVPFTLVTRRFIPLLRSLRNRQLLVRIILASVLLSINWCTYVWAVVNGHVVETALGYFIAPIFTLVIGVFGLHEHLRPIQRIAVGFAIAGVIVLTAGYGSVPYIALTLASSWSAYGLLKKQVTLDPFESLTAEVLVLCVPAVLLVAVSWRSVDSIPNSASAYQWVFVLLLGVATTVPLLLFAGAAHRTPLTILGPMQYLVPTINFLLGWLLYNEDVSATKLVGFGLIWVCLALVISSSVALRQRA